MNEKGFASMSLKHKRIVSLHISEQDSLIQGI